MTEPHPALRRQLRRCGLRDDETPGPAQWPALLDELSAYYRNVDEDRYTIERAFTISSAEMKALYERLKLSSEHELARRRDQLEHSLAILHAALDSMADGVLVVDDEWRAVTHNRRFLEVWRLPPELVEPGRDRERLALVAEMVEDPQIIWSHRTHAAEPRSHQLRLKDGRVFDRFIAPITRASGGLFGYLVLFRDVTQQRGAEDAVRRANRFLDSIVENLPDMIFVKDAKSLQFVRFNRAGEALLGRSRDELIGRSDFDFFPPDQAEAFTTTDRGVLAGGELVDIPEEPLETPHNGTRILHTKKIPIPDDNGAPLFLLGISRDITDQKRDEERLRAALELAERASRAKTEFLANMSHELRTPLNAIVGFARILGDDDFGPAHPHQREYLRYVRQAGEHMLSLVNDLLDLRRIEDKPQALEIDTHDVEPLVDAAVSMVRPLLDERGHGLRVVLPPAPAQCRCDPRAFVQVLINLLSNAAKYTPPGGRVELRAEVGSASARFEIEDSGVGIAPEHQAQLFTYFTQVGAKHRLQMQGSGVGLALTRSLVEAMGGSIDLSSSPGVGTTFRIHLPVGG